MEGTNYLEYIIPIIFIAIWVIGKMFSGKEEESSEEDADSSDTVYEYPEKEKFEKVLQSFDHEIGTERVSKVERIYNDYDNAAGKEEVKGVGSMFHVKSAPLVSPSKIIGGSGARISVLKLLKDTHSLKKSFVIAEMLNPPLALREDARTREIRTISSTIQSSPCLRDRD